MNNSCQIASHSKKKIIAVCLATQCQGNRVCCIRCQADFHSDHYDQLVDLESLTEFINTQSQKPDVLPQTVVQTLQMLSNLQQNLQFLMKQITQEIKRLSVISLQQYCRDIVSQYNIQTEQLGNQKWNELAQDMLSKVEIKNGELIEKNSDVKQLGQTHQLFMEQLKQQLTEMKNEFVPPVQNIDQNSFQQLIVPHLLEGHSDHVTGIDICEARNLLVSASRDGTVKLWNLSDFKQLKAYENTNWVYDVVFSSNGNLIAYGGKSCLITLIDISDLTKQDTVWELKDHEHTINRLIFSSDSMYLISGSHDNRVIIWSVESKNKLFQLNAESHVWGVAISNDNSLIASNEENGEIQIWKFKDQVPLVTQKNSIICGNGIQFSNDQKMLVSWGEDGLIIIWSLIQLDQGKLSLIKQIQASNKLIYSVSLTSDSRFIISHCSDERKVKVMDLSTGKQIKQFEVNDYNRFGDVAITKNADMIAYSNGNKIAVWKRN